MIKMDNFRCFFVESCVVEVHWIRLTEAILIHIRGMWFYGELMLFKVKILVYCENFMSMETFT